MVTACIQAAECLARLTLFLSR